MHPFPSVLDAAATAAVASVAGAPPELAARLAVGMLGLQFAIGTLNDLTDLEADRRTRPRKPLPSGDVGAQTARLVLVLCGLVGFAFAASAGVGAFAVALLGFAVGVVYDVRLKGTPFAWLAFALGVALLPAYAWWGATGALPAEFGLVFVLALLAGAALALSNAAADLETDRDAGLRSVATLFGRSRTLALDGVLLALVSGAVVLSSVAGGAPVPALAVELVGLGFAWAGMACSLGRGHRVRQLGWELQAIGVAVTAAGWFAALVASGALPTRVA